MPYAVILWITRWLVRCLVTFIAVIFLAVNASAYKFNDDNLALLDVVYQRQSVGNGLDVYINDDSFYIPLLDLMVLFEVDVSVTENGAQGTLGNKDDIFRLEKKADIWQVVLKDKTLNAPIDAVLLQNDLLYIDNKMAEEWFGAKFTLDFSDSNVELTLNKSLPFAERLARNNQTVGSQYDIGAAKQPEWKQPYQWIEVPSIDARLNYFSTRYEDKAVTAKSLNSTQYSLRTLGDFAAMSTETFLSGTRENGLAGATIRMDRYDHNRKLLGPLGFSQISIGDVTNPASGFGNSAFGRGILVGNDVAEGGSSRDIRTIEGDYYPDWDVELYLNNALVGYQTIDQTGHYAFKDVILFEGNNDFLLKFYGPTGQVDEKKRRIIVGDNASDLRKLRYSFSVTQPNKQVINIDNSSIQETEDDSYQVGFSSRFLLIKELGFSFGAQETSRIVDDETDAVDIPDPMDDPTLDDREYRTFRYYSWGAQSYFGGLSLSLNSTTEENGATQYGANLGGNLAGMLYQLRVLQYDKTAGFGAKIYTEDDNPLWNTYELSLNKRWGSHSFILRGANNRYKIGESNNGRFGYSSQFGMLGFSTALEYLDNAVLLSEKNDVFDGDIESANTATDIGEYLTGATFVSLSRRDVSFRLSGAYTIKPTNTLNAVSLSTAWRLDDEANVDASINHNLLTNSTFYRLGLSWALPSVRIVPSIAYSDIGYWQGQVQVSASLGNRTGRIGNYYRLGSDPTLTQGTIRARLYEDSNRNGRYELGEELLSGGEIQALQARRQTRSNKAGVAWLESMPSWGLTDIKVNENTIDAGYMAMGRDEFSIAPRPGRAIELDIPFTRVGEIDGTVVMTDGDFSVEAKGVTVLLMSSAGEVVAEHTTDSQGYFNFARVKPDSYRFKVKDRVLLHAVPEQVSIDNTGNYEPGIALTINMPTTEAEIDNFIENTPSPQSEENNTNVPDADSASVIEEPAFDGLQEIDESQKVESKNNTPENIDDTSATISETPDDYLPKITLAQPAIKSIVNTVIPTVMPSAIIKTVVSENSIPVKVADIPKNNAPQTAGQWRLQAGSFSSELIAQRFMDKANTEGLSSVMEPVTVKGVDYYRAYLGQFTTRDVALAAKSNIDATLKIQSIVVKPSLENIESTVGQLQ